MALTCKKILNLPYANQLKLLGGNEAANNKIKWVHYLEDPAYVSWLKGGELIIISGSVIKDNTVELIRLIDKLYDYHVAGIIINLSDYIKKISKEIIKEADELQLPLFEMAAEIRIVDISQSICYAIFQEQQLENQYQNAILELLYGQRMTERRIEHLKNIGIVDGKKYYTVAVMVRKSEQVQSDRNEKKFYDEDELQQLQDKIKLFTDDFWSGYAEAYASVQDDNVLLCYIQCDSYSIVKNEMNQLYEKIKISVPDIRMYISIGDSFDDIRKLQKCSENVKSMVTQTTCEGVVDYYENVIKRLVDYYPDQEELFISIQYILGDLLLNENKELLETLMVYLKNNQKVKDTAAEMYVHTNTIHYRLNKIQEIIGIDRNDYESMLQLQVALKVHVLFENTKNE